MAAIAFQLLEQADLAPTIRIYRGWDAGARSRRLQNILLLHTEAGDRGPCAASKPNESTMGSSRLAGVNIAGAERCDVTRRADMRGHPVFDAGTSVKVAKFDEERYPSVMDGRLLFIFGLPQPG